MRAVVLAAVLSALSASAFAQGFDVGAAFKRWDANADGVITPAEWAAAGRPAERFAAADADKDGKLTLEELAASVAKLQAPAG